MLRRLFTFASAVSLVLFAATVVVWVRSYFLKEEVHGNWHARDLYAMSGAGRLSVGESFILPERMEIERELPRYQSWPRGTSEVVIPSQLRRQRWQCLGVEWIQFRGGTYSVGQNVDEWAAGSQLSVPYSLLAIVLAVLPLTSAAHGMRRHQRLRTNRCVTCGYDLRASEDRCPECGTPITLNVEKTPA